MSVQLYHLTRYASSFSEHFYGLRRVATATGADALKRSHILTSLASLVLLPYVRAKIETLVFDEDARANEEGWIATLRRIYPSFSLACEAASLSFALFYAIGKSSVHSPTLSLSSVRLEVAPTVPVAAEPSNAGTAVRVLRGVADAFSATLATAAFLLHFMDWWNSQRKGSLIAEPPVPIPPIHSNNEQSEAEDDAGDAQPPVRRGVCPLCLNEIAARAAVLTTSGYVFCHACIRNHLSSGRTTCPVTGYPSSHDNIVLLVGQ